MSEKTCDLYCICNPLIDLLIRVESSELEELGLVKNSMNLVESDRQSEVLDQLAERHIEWEAGGSGANTAVIFSRLGGVSAFNGKIGNDEYGDKFVESLKRSGVHPCLSRGEGHTGSTVILIAEDASRTMNTDLAICREFSKKDLDREKIAASKLLYMTAYCWDTEPQKEAAVEAFKISKQNETRVALSLSDPFCVQRHKENFLELIASHVDLAIMNFEEASILLDTRDPVQMCDGLRKLLNHFVITCGEEGSLIYHGGKIHEIPGYPTEAMDTTGAGDCYAAGYFYGMGVGLGPERAGRLASYMASLVVAKKGPGLEGDARQIFKSFAKREGWK